MKKIFTLLSLALFGTVGASAETYTEEAVSVTWALPSTTDRVGVASPAAAIASSTWSEGGFTDVTSFSDNNSKVYTSFRNTDTSKDITQTITFTVTPYPGLTFTPKKVSFWACKNGTDGSGTGITVKALYGGETEDAAVGTLTYGKKGDVGRNNLSPAPKNHEFDLDDTKASTDPVTIKITIVVPKNNKQVGVSDVVISGTVSGTTAAVTKYAIAVASNNDSYGTVAKSVDEVVDGNEVTLTASANRGYQFVNWTDDDNANAEKSTDAIYTFAPTANVNYTGNFSALTEYTVNVAPDNAEAGSATVNSFADSKYYAGDQIYPEARPNLGYVFSKWSDNEEAWQHPAITLDSDVDLTANFEALPGTLSNAVWDLSAGDGSDDATVSNMAATVAAAAKVEFVGTQDVSGITFTKAQPLETADGSDDFSIVFTLTPTLSAGQAFVARSIELDAVRIGTGGGNFTVKVERDGVSTTRLSDAKPDESATHYYITLDDSKEVLSTLVVKIVLGGNLANNKQYGFANIKVNGYIRTATPTSVTIGDAGYATLYTEKALDFSGVSGLKAYTVSVDGSVANLTKVDNVPANTAVVLEGAADTYEIPATATSTTDKGELKGSNKETTADGTQYVLASKGGVVAFYKATADTKIAAGKGYLLIGGDAPECITFNIEGETTGIDLVNAKSVNGKSVNGKFFNLNGQRIAQPQKGLYIVNGKKVAIK